MSRERGARVKFSLYSEIQSWPGKSAAQLYGEVLEQISERRPARLRRLRGDRALLLPEVLHLGEPAARSSRPRRSARSGSTSGRSLHSMPYHNPVVLASQIAVADMLLDGRYEFGVGRGHGWMPPKAGARADAGVRERYEESVEMLFTALENERFSYDGKHFQIADSRDRAAADDRKFRVFLGGTSDRTYELAAERGWAVVVPPLLPYAALEGAARPLPREVRRARQRAGHRLDPRLLHRRGSRGRRGARPSSGWSASCRGTPRR